MRTTDQEVIVSTPSSFEGFWYCPPFLEDSFQFEHLVLECRNLFRDDDEICIVAEHMSQEARVRKSFFDTRILTRE